MKQIDRKMTLYLEPRGDGGLVIWSDDLPGLILSFQDQRTVLLDLGAAIVAILEHSSPSKMDDWEAEAKQLRAALTRLTTNIAFDARLMDAISLAAFEDACAALEKAECHDAA